MITIAVIGSDGLRDWVRAAVGEIADVRDAPPADVTVAALDTTIPPGATRIVRVGEPGTTPADAVHVVRRTIASADLRVLLSSIALARPVTADAATPVLETPADARAVQAAFGAARRLAAATDLATTEAIAIDTLVEMLDVDRAHCLFHGADTGELWSEAIERASGDNRRAIAGLAGFSAHTCLAANAIYAGDDARYVPAIDDPGGDPTDHIAVQPVLGDDGAVHAVIIVVRRARRSEFIPFELTMLARFATLMAPVLAQISEHARAQEILDRAADAGLFRGEAIAAQAVPRWGDVIRISPRWLPWAYWMLVALLLASAVFVGFGRVSTYSTGAAIVRSTARTSVMARTEGNVIAVSVAPGDRAEPDTVIAHLDDSEQRAAATRLELELETQLRNHMLDPADANADAAVRQLRLELESARTALAQRLIRAGARGIVGDLRVRPGQHVAPGDSIASVADATDGLDVIALLPGGDRPQLAPGMAMRLELAGYRYAYQSLVIDHVSSDVIAPAEARRVVGAEVADGLPLSGPVVLVRGHLPRSEFDVDGQTLSYHDGMVGIAEVRIRSERILFALFPGARRLQ